MEIREGGVLVISTGNCKTVKLGKELRTENDGNDETS
jgi:hypothetical protein